VNSLHVIGATIQLMFAKDRFGENSADRELVYNGELTAKRWALNSAVECHLHTVEVIGSNPIAPTNLTWSGPGTWVTQRTGYTGDNLGPNGLSRGSKTRVSKSK
jgi:hypothetical protein